MERKFYPYTTHNSPIRGNKFVLPPNNLTSRGDRLKLGFIAKKRNYREPDSQNTFSLSRIERNIDKSISFIAPTFIPIIQKTTM